LCFGVSVQVEPDPRLKMQKRKPAKEICRDEMDPRSVFGLVWETIPGKSTNCLGLYCMMSAILDRSRNNLLIVENK